MAKKVFMQVYGCQMSERDGETLAALAEKHGYTRTGSQEEADLIILNTCCVRESAENKIMGGISLLKKLKEKKPDLKIAVSGCMVQQPGAIEVLRKRAPHVDIWTGTFDLDKFQNLLDRSGEGHPEVCISQKENPPVELAPEAEKGKLRANVNIMYGCDNFCAYCIVPYVRGRERSRPREDVLREIQDLLASGCQEVTLLGQNVNSYGKKDGFAYDFADLLREIAGISGLKRVRFMTSHPKDLTDRLIQVVAEEEKICPHFHLPFQAGSDRTLAAMNRGYTRAYYLERVAAIKAAVPEARLTTDIIVGFPGESEEDFEQTLELIRQVHFSQAFTFMFSKRSGTAAAELSEQIPLDVKKRRLQRLMALQTERSLSWRKKMLHQVYEVLVEGPSKTDPQMRTGRTTGNEVIIFPGEKTAAGSFVHVKITDTNSWTMFGEIVSEKEI